MRSRSIWDDLIGIEWLAHGRDRDGCDCWGLHRLAMAEGAGVDLPSYAREYATTQDRAAIQDLIDGGRGAYVPINREAALAFDLVLIHGDPWHVGTIVRPGLMLHIPEGRTSVIEPLTLGRFGRRVEGIYRHEALR